MTWRQSSERRLAHCPPFAQIALAPHDAFELHSAPGGAPPSGVSTRVQAPSVHTDDAKAPPFFVQSPSVEHWVSGKMSEHAPSDAAIAVRARRKEVLRTCSNLTPIRPRSKDE